MRAALAPHALVLVLALGLAAGCASRADVARDDAAAPVEHGDVERGKASYYAARFHGRKTASGERFDNRAMTAAHKKLRFGTRVRVTNLRNGRHVVVRINDRGPYSRGRVIDLSRAAAERIGMIQAGVVPVEVTILELGPEPRTRGRGNK